MEGKCIVSGCGKAASKCCGSCGFVRYCSVECQKEDWKKHHKKDECVSMKKLASVNLTEDEICDVAERIKCISGRHLGIGEAKWSIHMNQECLDFVRDRLCRLDCDDSRNLMRDGVRLNHLILCRQLIDLGAAYFHMERSTKIDNHGISYLSEARELLVQNKDAGMNESGMWHLLYICDHQIYQLYKLRGQWEKAKYHCVEWIATARQCNVSDQVDYLIIALRMLSSSLIRECNFSEALPFAEESYIIASKHYSPAHKTVIEASGPLINCLISMGDCSTAETYCRMNYANLIDPVNAGEYSVDDGMNVMKQLVSIWLWKEPDENEIVEKALADEAKDLSRKMFAYACIAKGSNMQYRVPSLTTLCRVLLKRNELTKETEGLLHQLVTMCITEKNLDGEDMQYTFTLLHIFYLKIHESFPIGEESILVKENIILSHKRLMELESSNDGSVGYAKISQKIKPYFKGNAELHI